MCSINSDNFMWYYRRRLPFDGCNIENTLYTGSDSISALLPNRP